MIILAGAIILALNNSGIIGRASESTILFNISTIEEKFKITPYGDTLIGAQEDIERLAADEIVIPVEKDNKLYYIINSNKVGAVKESNLGKGEPSLLKDVYGLNEDYTVYYINESGKVYNDIIEIRNNIVNIPDEVLREYIKTALQIEDDNQITEWKMKNLKSLSAYGMQDITGLEYAVNLESLALGWCSVSDLTPIANLTKLKVLNIRDDSSLKDISPLEKLVNIEDLSLTGNNINNIDALKNMLNLKKLSLTSNAITNIDVVSNFSKLEELALGWNGVTNIKPIKNLKNLSVFSINNNGLSDISVLSELKNLKSLNLSANNINNISSLKNLNKLAYLNISYNQITDFSPIDNLTNCEIIK